MDKFTIAKLQERKRQGKKIVMLTAYDHPIAKLVDESGVDIVLVGDTLAMVVLGYETTTPVTMDEMIHHAKAARRGVKQALLVGDMPYVSLSGTIACAVRDAGRFVKEAGCDAVKAEWRDGIEDIAGSIIAAGIPVMGHVGLTPQTAASEGGFGMRGKDAISAKRIVSQACALEKSGCFAMVLECIPDVVAKEITSRLSIPTIGIGSGPFCDGQVLVTYDLLGLFDRFQPRFVKRYANLSETISVAVGDYAKEVRSGAFPSAAQTVSMAAEEAEKFTQEIGKRPRDQAAG